MVTHTYEVVPKGWTPETVTAIDELPFAPFLLDISADDHSEVSEARSARRAYFTAFSILREHEPEDWQLFEYYPTMQQRGPERGMNGLKKGS